MINLLGRDEDVLRRQTEWESSRKWPEMVGKATLAQSESPTGLLSHDGLEGEFNLFKYLRASRHTGDTLKFDKRVGNARQHGAIPNNNRKLRGMVVRPVILTERVDSPRLQSASKRTLGTAALMTTVGPKNHALEPEKSLRQASLAQTFVE